jgi:hypothetical protein
MARRKLRAKERDWKRHIETWRTSGLTQKDFCLENGLPITKFRWWKRELLKRGVLEKGEKQNRPVFVPVELTESHSESKSGESPPAFEVLLKGERVIRVPSGFDGDDFQRLVSILEAIPC